MTSAQYSEKGKIELQPIIARAMFFAQDKAVRRLGNVTTIKKLYAVRPTGETTAEGEMQVSGFSLKSKKKIRQLYDGRYKAGRKRKAGILISYAAGYTITLPHAFWVKPKKGGKRQVMQRKRASRYPLLNMLAVIGKEMLKNG